MMGITTYCRISENQVTVNGNTIKVDVQDASRGVVGDLYRQLKIDYPKFHKMDLLSKTAFMGTELLLKFNKNISAYQDDEIAMLFANQESSLYSDMKFEQSYTEGNNPSPSQFVYTLPNIMMGEIAIKNKWYGENLFLLMPSFQSDEFEQHIQLFENQSYQACVSGWVNVTGETLDAFFFITEKKTDIKDTEGMIALEKLNKLYLNS